MLCPPFTLLQSSCHTVTAIACEHGPTLRPVLRPLHTRRGSRPGRHSCTFECRKQIFTEAEVVAGVWPTAACPPACRRGSRRLMACNVVGDGPAVDPYPLGLGLGLFNLRFHNHSGLVEDGQWGRLEAPCSGSQRSPGWPASVPEPRRPRLRAIGQQRLRLEQTCLCGRGTWRPTFWLSGLGVSCQGPLTRTTRCQSC